MIMVLFNLVFEMFTDKLWAFLMLFFGIKSLLIYLYSYLFYCFFFASNMLSVDKKIIS